MVCSIFKTYYMPHYAVLHGRFQMNSIMKWLYIILGTKSHYKINVSEIAYHDYR